MIILDNKILKVEISETGAEIRKVLKNGENRMWSGDGKYWSGVSPILFPICSGLPDDEYTYNGKTYKMQKHGFVSSALFEVEAKSDDSATFLFKSNKETLKSFPFEFELRIKYTLINEKIKTEYFVLNKSNTKMYYSIGSHEGYACDEGIEEYDIVFEANEDLETCLLDGAVLSGETQNVLKNEKSLALKEEYFMVDALIFKKFKSKNLKLVNRKNGKTVCVSLPDAKYLLVWHPVGAPFICIELWEGICATKGDGKDITQKEGIIPLEINAENTHTHIIEFK